MAVSVDRQTQGEIPDAALASLLDLIYRRFHHDFRGYAPTSLKRRVGQALIKLGCLDVGELERRLPSEPETFTTLLRQLTVPVSGMFRDPSYYRALRERVLPVLGTYPSLKVWVAGCSTGEEAYSLAILLDEEGLLDRTLIYATDINPESLRVAAQGIYPSQRLTQYAADHQDAGGRGPLGGYFAPALGDVSIAPRLRSRIVFSDHSLATDTVFTEVHLVSCRNVLIYFGRALQDRTIRLFEESLCHRGFLGLGSKESLSLHSDPGAFRPFVPEERIYQKNA